MDPFSFLSSICVLVASIPLLLVLYLSFSQDSSRGFYLSARNGVAALHGSKSLTRCRRFSPLDSLSALLAPTCLDCNDTPPIRSLTLASHPNKASMNTRNVFCEVFPRAHINQFSCRPMKTPIL